MSAIFSLWIINKAGGLIYQKDFAEGIAQLSANEYLVLSGTFHGIHAITSRLAPTGRSSGVEVIETSSFKLSCFQSSTGIKFVLITSPTHPNPNEVLQHIYEAYANQLKDPFYTVEMPIRSDKFDTELATIVKEASR